jgi:pilus assembly protein CpaF
LESQRSVSHVSHFPLEREPDSESAPDLLGHVPGSARPRSDPSASAADGTGPLAIRGGEVSSVARLPLDAVGPAGGETPEQVAYRRTLAALVERVGDLIDLSPLAESLAIEAGLSQRIDEAVHRQSRALRAEGGSAASVDVEQLSRDALRELLGLGPIGPLLEDDEVSEVHVARHDSVLVMGSGPPSFALPAFTSEAALARVVTRLIGQSGVPVRTDEWVVERRLARGARMVALLPPLANRVSLTIRKGRRVQATLSGLLSARAVSSSMVAFLAACVEARSNVLVVGSGTAAVVSTIAALVSTGRAGERIAIVGGADEIIVGEATPIVLPAEDDGRQGAESIKAATRLGTDRLVVMSLAGEVAAATVDAIGGGCEGVIAGVRAPSLRHAVARLAAQVALARPGASIEVAREAVGESFDVAVELSRPGDGRLRVLRVAEVAGADVNGVALRDLFVAASAAESRVGNTPDFAATGARPRFTQEFEARGIKLDEGLFKKAKSQSQ